MKKQYVDWYRVAVLVSAFVICIAAWWVIVKVIVRF